MEFFNTFSVKLITTFLWSMVPVIELRGAIPIGTALGLDLWLSILVSVLGNMLPVPFIIVFIRRIFEWMRTKSEKLDKIVCAMENKAEKNRAVVDRYKFWGLVVLVAIPLPGTGAWTGALVAAMMEMRLKDAVPAIFLGVIGASAIVAVVTGGIFAFL